MSAPEPTTAATGGVAVRAIVQAKRDYMRTRGIPDGELTAALDAFDDAIRAAALAAAVPSPETAPTEGQGDDDLGIRVADCKCCYVVDSVALDALTRRAAADRAKVARVEALVDAWEPAGPDCCPGHVSAAADLRRALDGEGS